MPYSEIPISFLDGIPANPLSAPVEHSLGDTVRDCLEKLDPEDMLILLQRFNEGATLQTIGDGLDMSRQGADWRVRRALDRLKELLIEEGVNYE